MDQKATQLPQQKVVELQRWLLFAPVDLANVTEMFNFYNYYYLVFIRFSP